MGYIFRIRALVFAIVSLVGCLSVHAQSIPGAFFIHQTDGRSYSFLLSEVDSIVYSNISANGSLNDELQAQRIYTADSIFTIDIADVDSIAFIDTGDEAGSHIGWSDLSDIVIPEQPRCAVVNITGTDALPKTRSANIKAWMEVWDGRGHYFKKRVILKLNGDSTIQKEKKNFAADFCEDEWIGEQTTNIKIGQWVTRDGFHFKAYHTSITKGEAPINYKLYDKFLATKPIDKRAPYLDYYSKKKITSALLNNDESLQARCYPDGFPCIVYLNGKFYGIFSWQLNKHRDNFNLSRNKTDNIHLDGYLGADEIWNGDIAWNRFEVRNPKPKEDKWTLLCQDGTVYDGNNPKELMGTDAPTYNEADESCRNSAKTKENIVALSHYMQEISLCEEDYQENRITLEELKAEIDKRFSMEWLTDYIILINIIQNNDAIKKNWQWVTWGKIDGTVRWYVNPYDLDSSYGVTSTTAFSNSSANRVHIGESSNTPAKYVWLYFLDEMKARYAELRRANVISYDTMTGLFKDWTERVGAQNYQYEAERWPDMPCNRDNYISDKWARTGKSYITYQGRNNTWTQGTTYSEGSHCKYEYRCYQSLKSGNKGHMPSAEDSEWWRDVTVKAGKYHKGDLIFDGRSNFYEFRALEDVEVTQGNDGRPDGLTDAPFGKFYPEYPYEGGVHDSIDRIFEWIKKKIQRMDAEMDYSS